MVTINTERETDWRSAYREAKEDTIGLLAARFSNDVDEARGIKFLDTIYHERAGKFAQSAVFGLLVQRYRRKSRLSRRELREQLEDGSFWENFLEFLQGLLEQQLDKAA